MEGVDQLRRDLAAIDMRDVSLAAMERVARRVVGDARVLERGRQAGSSLQERSAVRAGVPGRSATVEGPSGAGDAGSGGHRPAARPGIEPAGVPAGLEGLIGGSDGELAPLRSELWRRAVLGL